MKKQIRIAIVIVSVMIIAVLIVELVRTVPVYPAFQKSVDSIEEIKRTFQKEAVVYPRLEETGLDITDTVLWLDGRAVVSKANGYLIFAAEQYEDTELEYTFSGIREEDRQTQVNTSTYRDVTISVSYYMSEPVRAYGVTLRFSIGEWVYTLDATGRDEVSEQRSQQQREVTRDYMQDFLFEVCHQMIDDQ